jgi:hypothetical protein
MEDVLPKQTPEDDYNCGIGAVAAIGIMLCDVIVINQDDNFKFANIFSKKALIVSICNMTGEYVCSFPEDTFQRLPPPHEMSVFGKTYLALLKEQWFILFDRLALLYHETLCKQLDADCVLDDNYIGYCNKISVQQWPPSVVITKQDQSSSPPEKTSFQAANTATRSTSSQAANTAASATSTQAANAATSATSSQPTATAPATGATSTQAANAATSATSSQPTAAAPGTTTIIPANQTVGAHSKQRAYARCE